MQPSITYAGFWLRLGAAALDFAFLLPVNLGVGWLASLSKEAALVLLLPLWIAGAMYEPVLHAMFGATLGKFAMGIRVVNAAGGPIYLSQAFVRSSVALATTVGWIYGALPVFALPADAFHGQGWLNLFKLIRDDFHSRYETISHVSGIWFWSEFVTMLLNERRRAIHDFLAGTVVIRVRRGND